MEDWEDEPIRDLLVKQQPKFNWDDEDLDDTDVKESWEDEDEPALAPKLDPTPPETPKKAQAISSKKKVKVVEAAEKLDQLRLVEEADIKFAITKLLGDKGGDEKTLGNFIPETECEFSEYAGLIDALLIRPYQKSYHCVRLLKDLNRPSLTALKVTELKEFSAFVATIMNEKIKKEKETNAGRKKTAGGKKKQKLHVEKLEDDVYINSYNDYRHDNDFM